MSELLNENQSIGGEAVELSENQPVYSSFSDDEDFAELIEFFVDAIPERQKLLRQHWEQEKTEEIRTLAHQLKGAGGGYGFEGLSEQAARLESACKQSDSAAIEESLEVLVDYMGRISV